MHVALGNVFTKQRPSSFCGEWRRGGGVERKQKTRTENLAARGTKGKAKAKKRKEIVKKRAGFEGAAKPLN